ncbi:hypothetical protein GU926_06230 [Nibribacter ruber]|uniref:UPF0323 domain-containing protein n=1 Tax=Nibribacter ruber TaxID=2698458 RepID=A0A6P1NYI2_9BACT|nr:hypothetical protein [Nibribacter ruber]QHL87055.1 hypothetical protein GU926_06230 [Nibribacter ruber]
MKKRYFKVGDFSRNMLLVSAAACLGLTTVSCSDNRSAQETSTEWNAGEEAVPAYSQGVVTELTEVGPDNWKITDEQPAAAGQVMAILKHQDGKIDTLQGPELETRMKEYAQVNPQNGSGFSMMNVLMWSSIGYMAGRMLSPNPRYYANPNTIQRNDAWRQQTTQERSRGAQAFKSTSGPYSTRPSTTTTRSTRPSSSRSGWFGGRSSGRSGGFGG